MTLDHPDHPDQPVTPDYLAYRKPLEDLLAEPGAVRHVDAAILSRRTIRAFLPTPVPRATVEEILMVARQAPSGTNLQPWKVYLLSDARRQHLTEAIIAAHNDPVEAARHVEERAYYPHKFFEPYLARRRATGWGLYGLLGITRDDRARMREQGQRNYKFFDAPVGMICTIHRDLEIGSWLDYGMFLQNIMVAARARGLDTCAQAAFTDWHKLIRPLIGVPEEEIVVCGMSLGYADRSKVENNLQTERMPIGELMQFVE